MKFLLALIIGVKMLAPMILSGQTWDYLKGFGPRDIDAVFNHAPYNHDGSTYLSVWNHTFQSSTGCWRLLKYYPSEITDDIPKICLQDQVLKIRGVFKMNDDIVGVGFTEYYDSASIEEKKPSDLIFIKVDSNGLLLESKYVRVGSGNEFHWVDRVVRVTDSTVLICGHTKPYSNSYHYGFLAETTLEGKVLWMNRIHPGNGQVRSAVIHRDTIFAVGHNYKHDSGFYPFLYKLNRGGQVISGGFMNMWGNSYLDDIKVLGEMFIGAGGISSVAMDRDFFPVDSVLGYTVIFDEQLDVIKQQIYSTRNLDQFFRGVFVEGDDIYLFGRFTDTANYTTNNIDGWIIKLDLEYNIEWARSYGHQPYNDLPQQEEIFGLFLDGEHIVTYGWSIDRPNGSISSDAWVMRLDSNGCGVPFVDCSSSSVKLPPRKFTELNYLPNPAKQFIKLQDPEIWRKEYSIINIVGKKVLSGKVPDQGIISLAGLPQGEYMIIVAPGENESYPHVGKFTKTSEVER